MDLMLESFLSEALAVTSDNLNLSMEMLACAEEAAIDLLEEESLQKLRMVHIGLALAIEALQDETLQSYICQSTDLRILQ
jgi:hypothetical protein